MTNQEAHEQVIMWLGALLGITVIKDRQQADRPAMPYGMVDLVNWSQVDDHATDMSYVDVDADTVHVTPEHEMEWVFLLFVYGVEGDVLVRRLQSGYHLLQVQEPLLKVGLILREVSRANSVPELVGETWEPRTQVNITVRGMSSEAFPTDVIETHDFNYSAERL